MRAGRTLVLVGATAAICEDEACRKGWSRLVPPRLTRGEQAERHAQVY
jgi:hypothetical protein